MHLLFQCDMLLYICRVFGGMESEEFKNQKYIFLGDYVDRYGKLQRLASRSFLGTQSKEN